MKSEDSPASIDNLDDYSLITVFNYLPAKDLINIEKVSDRWKYLSLGAWPNRKNLNVWEDFGNISALCKEDQLLMLENVLQKCQNYVTHLSISSRYCGELSTETLFTLISEHFPKLTYLDISHVSYKKSHLELFPSTLVQSLKCASLSYLWDGGYSFDDKYSDFLQKAVNLEEIYLSDRIRGSCLINLTNNWKVISFHGCRRLQTEHFVRILEKSSNLEKLNISFCHSLYLNDLKKEVQGSKHNTLLLKHLHTLKMNHLSGSNIRCFSILAKICPMLEDLDISGLFIGRIKVNFSSLADFKKIKYLNVFHTEISDHAMELIAENCTALELLDCRRCYEITEAGLIRVVAVAPALTMLKITTNKLITSHFFKSTLYSVVNRASKKFLTTAICYYRYNRLCKEDPWSMEDPFVVDEIKRLKLIPLNSLKDDYPTEFKRYNIVFGSHHPELQGEILYVKYDENDDLIESENDIIEHVKNLYL